MFSDCIDSYFKYIKNRVIAINSSRLVPGIIEANAWPPAEIENEAFYLLIIDENTSKNFGTVSSQGIVHIVQWTWVVIGNDLPQANQIGKNKGNRYRNNAKMKQELIRASFPGFCDKNTYTPQQQGNTLVSVATPVGEKIWWSALKFPRTKFQDKSGVIYGAAQAFVSEFGDLITQ